MDHKDKIGFLPVCPFEGEHPDMLIRGYEPQDVRLSVSSGAFAEDTQSWD